MPETKKSSELLKKYLERFESKQTEPQEIIILGTFIKKDSLATTSRETTGKSSTGIKQKSNKPESTDTEDGLNLRVISLMIQVRRRKGTKKVL